MQKKKTTYTRFTRQQFQIHKKNQRTNHCRKKNQDPIQNTFEIENNDENRQANIHTHKTHTPQTKNQINRQLN